MIQEKFKTVEAVLNPTDTPVKNNSTTEISLSPITWKSSLEYYDNKYEKNQ